MRESVVDARIAFSFAWISWMDGGMPATPYTGLTVYGARMFDDLELEEEESPAPEKPDHLAKWEHVDTYRPLHQFLWERFTHLHEEQGKLQVQFHHELNLNSTPEKLFEDLIYFFVRDNVETWAAAAGRALHVRRNNSNYPDLGIWEEGVQIMGVEVKTFNIMSLEGVPTARFKVTPEAIGRADILIVACYLRRCVVGDFGPAELKRPWIESARLVAHERALENERQGKQTDVPEVVGEYGPRDHINDHVKGDKGSNGGRLGRVMESLRVHINDLLLEPHTPDGRRDHMGASGSDPQYSQTLTC